MIYTKINNNNSTLNHLELNYSYTNGGSGGGGYTPPSLSVIKARQWDVNLPPFGDWQTVFDLKADGNQFLGTQSGSNRLNIVNHELGRSLFYKIVE